MPKLGDFLGELLTEVTMARVQADLESVRVAELYASHPLLKHMPVPRFRLPTVHFDVPVLIRGEEDRGSEEAPRLDPEQVAANFVRIVDSVLEQHDWKLNARERNSVKSNAVDTIARHRDLPPDVAGSVTGTVNDLVKIAMRTVRRSLKQRASQDPVAERLASMRDGLRREVMSTFIRFLVSPRRLEADITTSHVKEAGSSDMLARVKMEVTEDGVEWATVTDPDGELAERLVSE